MYSYDQLFYGYQSEGSARSARAVLPLVLNTFGVRSVLDVGCGVGAWLAEYARAGVVDYRGVDGDYVDRAALLIEPAKFEPKDISKPFELGRTFGLVQCLEVAEHVSASCSGTLVDSIVRHGKLVLFSAAVPGQGGENHINEQPYEYWRDLFKARGYRLFDFIRPSLRGRSEIEPWYRYNLLLFAHDQLIPTLPAAVLRTRVEDHSSIQDLSPSSYRLRKLLLRQLSPNLQSKLAVVKHKLVVAMSPKR